MAEVFVDLGKAFDQLAQRLDTALVDRLWDGPRMGGIVVDIYFDIVSSAVADKVPTKC